MALLVVRSSSGAVKSVVTGGRQYAYGSVGYNKGLTAKQKAEVEARSSGRATILQSEGGTSVYAGSPGQEGSQKIASAPGRVVPAGTQVIGVQKTPGGYSILMQTRQTQAQQPPQNRPGLPPQPSNVGRPQMPSDWLTQGIVERGQYFQNYEVGRQPNRQETTPVYTSLGYPKDLVGGKPSYYYRAGNANVKPFMLGVQLEGKNNPTFADSSAIFLGTAGVTGWETVKSFSPYDKGFKVPGIIEQTGSQLLHPVRTMEELQTSFQTSPVKTAGSLAGSTAAIAATFGVGRAAISTGRNIRIYAAKPEFVPPEKVFAPEVLSGEKVFPTQKGLADSLRQFRQAKVSKEISLLSKENKALLFSRAVEYDKIGKIPTDYTYTRTRLGGTHTTDISPAFKEDIVQIKIGKAGEVLKEDPVHYITPKGRGSAYFTRLLPHADYEYKLGLNPLETPKPAAINYEYVSANRLPRWVIKSRGYAAVGEYLKGQVHTGKVFVTKRSMVSTSEVEAGIPENTFAILKTKKPITKYTAIGSRLKFWRPLVPIKEYYLLRYKSRGKVPSSVEDFSVVDLAKSSSRKYKSVEPYSKIPRLKYEVSSSSSSKPNYSLSSSVSKASSKSSAASSSSSKLESYKYSSSKLSEGSSSKISSSSSRVSSSSSSLSSSSSSLSSSKSSISRGGSSRVPSSITPPPPVYYSRVKASYKKSKKKLSVTSKPYKRRKKSYSFIVIPDLLSVSQYEARTGKEAVSPRLTPSVKRSFTSGLRGTSFYPRIPTLQQQNFKRRKTRARK